jgi:DNA-binding MarR family transcriptional regulator
MIEATITRLLGAYRPMLEAAWQRLTLAKRAVLRAIASEGGRNLLAAEVRRRHGLGPKSSVQRALGSLLAEEWITRENDRYAFVDSLHREWVLRETR